MKPTTAFVGFAMLKQAVSMAQVLDRYGLTERLRRSGDSLSGACPLHAGHNPTQFRVSLAKNCWICFGDCHGGGSIIDFVSRKEGVGVREAGLLIQDWFGVPPSDPGAVPLAPAPHEHNGHTVRAERFEPRGNPPLRFTLSSLDAKHPYLEARGLTLETIQTFGLGFCANGSLAGWIAIPLHDASGRLIGYAGRWPGEPPNGQPKYRLPRGFRKSLEVFNQHRVPAPVNGEPLVVVEGFFGCMRIWQAGFRRVVSLMGSMMSAAQASVIVQAAKPHSQVVLMFDEDEAGRKGRQEAQHRLGSRVKTRVVRFEQERQQPENLSVEELRRMIGESGLGPEKGGPS
jgi:DNA primase